MAMDKQVIAWEKENMFGWTRYKGNSQNFGPYIIEKEDTRSYSIWWGGVDIGEASSVPAAKKVAAQHANSHTQIEHKGAIA